VLSLPIHTKIIILREILKKLKIDGLKKTKGQKDKKRK
jgi:hypothetical protein